MGNFKERGRLQHPRRQSTYRGSTTTTPTTATPTTTPSTITTPTNSVPTSTPPTATPPTANQPVASSSTIILPSSRLRNLAASALDMDTSNAPNAPPSTATNEDGRGALDAPATITTSTPTAAELKAKLIKHEPLFQALTSPSTNATAEENTIKVATPTPTPSPENTPPAAPRKRKASALATPTPSSDGDGKPPNKKGKTTTASDPINIMIYDLHQQGLDFAKTAELVSEKYGLMRTGDKWSEPACYGRFKRNGAAVAASRGERFDMDWYTHMKGPIDINQIKIAQPGGDDDSEMTDDTKPDLNCDKVNVKAGGVALVEIVAAMLVVMWKAVAKDMLGDDSDESVAKVREAFGEI